MVMSKSRYIQLIHIAKSQLGWDDDLYRQVLSDLTKKTSCKNMNVTELKKVLGHMESKGFKVVTKKRGKGKNSPITRDKADKNQLDKLRQLWIAMKYRGYIKDGSEEALLKWSKSQAQRLNKNVAIERLEWLKDSMLHRLIEQLKKWYVRVMANDMDDLYPDLAALNFSEADHKEFTKCIDRPFSSCSVEALEQALDFTGLMLEKYEVQNV